MDNLEGTSEFNRQHRLLNQAGLDPYLDMPIPNQQPLNIPREELYDKWQEYVGGDWEHLDGQEYQPSPMIVPDTRVGFDADGHFHSVEHFTVEALENAITPFRWAEYLQDALVQYCSTNDYTVGAAERDDIVQDIISERMESLDSMEDRYKLEEALEIWRNKYGN